MKTYKIYFKQRFMGEISEDSYTRTVKDERELLEVESALYDDPHVISVSWELIE